MYKDEKQIFKEHMYFKINLEQIWNLPFIEMIGYVRLLVHLNVGAPLHFCFLMKFNKCTPLNYWVKMKLTHCRCYNYAI